MKRRKLEWNLYQTGDSEAMARHLEKRAAQGWHLEQIGPWGWRYGRGKPKAVHYAITYFPDASVFDPEPGERQETYIDYCAAAGWELAASNGPLQIFRSEKEAPTPIETDEKMKLEAVHRASKKNTVLPLLVLLAMSVVNLFVGIRALLRSPLEMVANNLLLMGLLCSFLLIAVEAVTLADYFIWYARSKKAVERGGACLPVHTRLRLAGQYAVLGTAVLLMAASWLETSLPGEKILFLINGAMYVLMLLAAMGCLRMLKRNFEDTTDVRWGYFVLALILALVFAFVLARVRDFIWDQGLMVRKPAAVYTDGAGKENNLYRDHLPMALEDMGLTVTEADACSYTAEVTRSPLAVRQDYRQFAYDKREGAARLPTLRYQITTIPWDTLRDWIIRREIRQQGMEPSDPAPWNADRVYRVQLTEEPGRYYTTTDRWAYLLVRGDQVAQIWPHQNLPAEAFAAGWSWE